MAWTTNPTRRNDLLLETYPLLDGSGNYSGDWLETSGITTIRVALAFNGGSPIVHVDEGQYDPGSSDPRIVRSQSITIAGNRGYTQLDLTARYFRLVVVSGLADNPFLATVRMV